MSDTQGMTGARIVIGTRRYSSWSLRGWLAVRLAGLEVDEEVVPIAGGVTPGLRARTPSGTVPALFHEGRWIWESLAIVEYCAELAPALWPDEAGARAHARSIGAEMHAGFRALRQAMPMNLGRDRRPLAGGTPEAAGADIARITAIWQEARARSGGPFLYGQEFGAADAMYAPVVARLLSYDAVPDATAAAYARAVRAHPLVAAWYDAAAAEPAAWLLPDTENRG